MGLELLPVLIQVSVIFVTIGAVWWQVRRQWLAHSATLLASLEEQFRSKPLIQARVKLAEVIQAEMQKEQMSKGASGPKALIGYWSVISFFDNIGAMVQRKAIDEELVWCRFGWRITRCYIALSRTKLLEGTRRHYKEDFMYDRFEWLAKRLLRRYPSKTETLEPARATDEYLEQEVALLGKQEVALLGSKHSSQPKGYLESGGRA